MMTMDHSDTRPKVIELGQFFEWAEATSWYDILAQEMTVFQFSNNWEESGSYIYNFEV